MVKRNQKRIPANLHTAVEFAIIAPVFILLIIGTIALCFALFLVGSLHYAVEDGARCASVKTTICSDSASTIAYTQSLFGTECIAHLYLCVSRLRQLRERISQLLYECWVQNFCNSDFGHGLLSLTGLMIEIACARLEEEDECEESARQIVEERWAEITTIAEELLDRTQLDADDLDALLGNRQDHTLRLLFGGGNHETKPG
jgi:hypothetical protein